MLCDQGKDRGTQFFGGGNIQQSKVQTFGLAGRPLPQFPLLVAHPYLPIRKTLRRVLSLLIVMILKSEWEYFLSKQQIYRSTDFKVCDVIIDIVTWWKLHLRLFLLNPKYYENEILVCCMKNISNIFLAHFWRLKTASRPFYNFTKMTI